MDLESAKMRESQQAMAALSPRGRIDEGKLFLKGFERRENDSIQVRERIRLGVEDSMPYEKKSSNRPEGK